MNQFVLASGAIPTVTWLDGTTDGERAIEELFEVSMRSGAAAINLIPDRNYTPGAKDGKLKNLQRRDCAFRKARLPDHRRHGNERAGK